MIVERRWRIGMRVVALGYFLALLLLPVALVFYRTFENGVGFVIDSITTPAAISAFWLTIEVTAIAVPLNAAVGHPHGDRARSRGASAARRMLNALLDLPFAISPVVIGLSLVLLYGRTGWLGPWLADHGIQIIFSVPGIVLATIFVSLPFVVREVTPVLKEIGDEQEQAACDAGRRVVDDVPPHHVPRDPLGPRLRDRAVGRPRDRRVRRRERRLRPRRRRDADPDAARAAALRELRPRRRLRSLGAAGRHRAAHAASR